MEEDFPADPEYLNEEWFTAPRLDKFSIEYKKFPVLWLPSHNKFNILSARRGAYVRLAKAMGVRAGHGVASRAARLCRLFIARLKQELARACAAAAAAARRGAEAGAGGALAHAPRWARRADRYLQLLAGVHKVPESQSRRIVRGMRRAARRTDAPDRAAAAILAEQLGQSAELVYELWASMRAVSLQAVRAQVARGDAVLPRARAPGSAPRVPCGAAPAPRASALHWAAADLMFMYGTTIIQDEHYKEYETLRALVSTFQLVQQCGLEPPPPEPSVAWRRAARLYSVDGVAASPLALQRRWFELRLAARRSLRAAVRRARHDPRAPLGVLPIHRAVARRYPHVVTGEFTPWNELRQMGKLAKPTSERGAAPGEGARGGAHSDDSNAESDDDIILVEDKIETIDLDGDEKDAATNKETNLRDMPIINSHLDDAESSNDHDKGDSEEGVTVKEVNGENDENIDIRTEVDNTKELSKEVANNTNDVSNRIDKTVNVTNKTIDVVEKPKDSEDQDRDVLEALQELDVDAIQTTILFESDEEETDLKFDNHSNSTDVHEQNSGEETDEASIINDVSNFMYDNQRDVPKVRVENTGNDGDLRNIENKDFSNFQESINDESVVNKVDSSINNENKSSTATDKVSNKVMDDTESHSSKRHRCHSSESSESDSGNLVIDHDFTANDVTNDDISKSTDYERSEEFSKNKLLTMADETASKDSFSSANSEDVENSTKMLNSKPNDSESDESKKDGTTHISEHRYPLLSDLLSSASSDVDRFKKFKEIKKRMKAKKALEADKELVRKKEKAEVDLKDLIRQSKIDQFAKDLINELVDENCADEPTDEEEVAFDPKLLMFPVVELTRLEPTSVLGERNLSLLRACRPCSVALQRADVRAWGAGEGEGEGGGGGGRGRVAKRVSLPTRDDVRRNNRSLATAQVAPITEQRAGGRVRAAPSAADLARLLDDLAEPEPGADAACDAHICCSGPDSVGSPRQGAHSTTSELSGEKIGHHVMRSVMRRGCARCVERALCAPPACAAAADVQRALVRRWANQARLSQAESEKHRKNRERKEPAAPARSPPRARSPYDAARALQEWVRQKNLVTEKFGLKPRSYRKGPPDAERTRTVVTLNKSREVNTKPLVLNTASRADRLLSVHYVLEHGAGHPAGLPGGPGRAEPPADPGPSAGLFVDLDATHPFHSPGSFPVDGGRPEGRANAPAAGTAMTICQDAGSTQPLQSVLRQNDPEESLQQKQPNIFNLNAVADINKKLNHLASNDTQACNNAAYMDAESRVDNSFFPIITNVQSLAKDSPHLKKTPSQRLSSVGTIQNKNSLLIHANQRRNTVSLSQIKKNTLSQKLKDLQKKIVNEQQNQGVQNTGSLGLQQQANLPVGEQKTLLRPGFTSVPHLTIDASKHHQGAVMSQGKLLNAELPQAQPTVPEVQRSQVIHKVTNQPTYVISGSYLSAQSSFVLQSSNQTQSPLPSQRDQQIITLKGRQAFPLNSVYAGPSHTLAQTNTRTNLNMMLATNQIGALNACTSQNSQFSMIVTNQQTFQATHRQVPVGSAQAGPRSVIQVNPQAVQVNPQAVQVNPQAVQVNPQAVQVNPQAVQVNPQAVQVNPQAVQVNPQAVQVNPQAVQVNPHAVQPQAVQVNPLVNPQLGMLFTNEQLNALQGSMQAGSQANQFVVSQGELSQTNPQVSMMLASQPPRAAGPGRAHGISPASAMQEIPAHAGSSAPDVYSDTESIVAISPLRAAEYCRGRDPTTLTVAALESSVWRLAGHLVLSEAPPAPSGALYALQPLRRLILPEEEGDTRRTQPSPCGAPSPPKIRKTTDYPPKNPPWLKVKSFAKMADSGGTGERTQETPKPQETGEPMMIKSPVCVHLENKVYRKLCDKPLTYAKVLSGVRGAAACRALLRRRAPLYVYALASGALTHVQAEPAADGASIVLTAAPDSVGIMHELARALHPLPPPKLPELAVPRPQQVVNTDSMFKESKTEQSSSTKPKSKPKPKAMRYMTLKAKVLNGVEISVASTVIADQGGAQGGGQGPRGGHADKGHTDKGHADKGHTDKGHADKGHTDKGHADKGHTDKGHADKGHADKTAPAVISIDISDEE